jgi:endonuclease YncB( thermonuclease family)
LIGKCVGIADGDTISVMRDGMAVKIRLEGIDAAAA